jgi:hypothetical protein
MIEKERNLLAMKSPKKVNTIPAIPADYINIVPVFPDRPDYTVKEICRQAKSLGIRKFALSLSFHPQTSPASKLIAPLCKCFARVREGLEKANLDIEFGALIQSHSGHGWNGRVSLTNEKWQKIVNSDGTLSPRFCALDKGFQGYVENLVDSLVREKPAFLLVDDDFGPRDWECYCPLHAELYRKALGNASYSDEELRSLVRTKEWNDPEVAKLSKARAESVLPLAKLIRRTIDKINPQLRCGICVGVNYGFGHKIAKALAGPNTAPFIRIGNGIYGGKPNTIFYSTVRKTYRMLNILSSVEDILNEGDTFPQNQWGTNAEMFGAQTALGLWAGIKGAKLWLSEFESPYDKDSQNAFEQLLIKRGGLHRELLNIGRTVKRDGVASPLYDIGALAYNSEKAGAWLYGADWGDALLGPFGFPICWSKPIENNVFALCGFDAQYLSNKEIRQLLSKRVIIDSHAAKLLTKRGFASLMGVKADDGEKDFFFTREDWVDDNNLRMNLMWEEGMARRIPCSPQTRVLTEFRHQNGVTDLNPKIVSPGITVFENKLGGRVCVTGWSPMEPFFKKFRITRKLYMLKIFEWLCGSVPDCTFAGYGQVLVQTGVLPSGERVLFALNLSSDSREKLSVYLKDLPKTAQLLGDDGAWHPIRFVREKTHSGVVSFNTKLVHFAPKVIKFN